MRRMAELEREIEDLKKKLKEAHALIFTPDYRQVQEEARIGQQMEATTLLIHSSLGKLFWFLLLLVYNFNIIAGQTARENENLHMENSSLRVSLVNLQAKLEAVQAQLVDLQARVDAVQPQ